MATRLDRILSAAKNSMLYGNKSPHCFSAHVPGQGYVNDGSAAFDRAEYRKQLDRAVQGEIENMGFAPGYAEPGYSDPEKGILFADWNKFPKNFDRILERAGYEAEWSDEWCTCGDCGKAVRTSPDSYGWTSSYRIMNECEVICLNCLDPVEYLESIEDNPNSSCPPDWNPADHGYVKHNGDFETGFHPGQNDDPKKILKALHAEGKTGIVFRIASIGQFDVTWEAYYKAPENLQVA